MVVVEMPSSSILRRLGIALGLNLSPVRTLFVLVLMAASLMICPVLLLCVCLILACTMFGLCALMVPIMVLGKCKQRWIELLLILWSTLGLLGFMLILRTLLRI